MSSEFYLHTRHGLLSADCPHQPSSICTRVTVCSLRTVDISRVLSAHASQSAVYGLLTSAEFHLHTRHGLQSADCPRQPSSICTRVMVCSLLTVHVSLVLSAHASRSAVCRLLTSAEFYLHMRHGTVCSLPTVDVIRVLSAHTAQSAVYRLSIRATRKM